MASLQLVMEMIFCRKDIMGYRLEETLFSKSSNQTSQKRFEISANNDDSIEQQV